MAAVRGCLTAAIAYGCGMQGLHDRIVLGCFVACGVSRLAGRSASACGGVVDIAGFQLHPLVLLFALSGSLMMSRICIP